jgi:hypothetical protein
MSSKSKSSVNAPIPIELNYKNAVDRYLLVPLEKSDLGSEPDFERGSIRVFLGSQPLCFNLVDIYLKENRKVPKKLKIFDQYDIWLVTYSVSIIKTGSWKKLHQIGLEVNYPCSEDDPRVIIVSNMPETYFKKMANGRVLFNAGLQLNGQMGTKVEDLKLSKYFSLGFGGQLSLTDEANISFDISFNLLSPKVISIGIGDHHGEWVMQKDDIPLVGDQLFSQTLLTPKGILKLPVKARVSGVITGPMGSFPVKMKSEWKELALISSLENSSIGDV